MDKILKKQEEYGIIEKNFSIFLLTFQMEDII